MKTWIITIAALVALATPVLAQGKLTVMTTTEDLASIAREVGGDRITVDSIAKGYQDPHFVEAKPSFILRLQKADLLIAVGLPALATRIADEAHWNRILSLGEQQRIAVARAILHAPDFLLLDECTASLDEPAEAALYRLLRERLPNTTIISIGHRSTLAAFHTRHLALKPDGDHFTLREAELATAPS